jgi:predicted permease
VLSFLLSLPDEPYKSRERTAAFLTDLDANLRALPGVVAVAASSALPPDLLAFSNNYVVEGQVPDTPGRDDVADWNLITPDYFNTLRIGITRGRAFGATDRDGTPSLAIVNEAFVHRHYPDGHAIGKRLKAGEWDASDPWTTIVGVVRDVPYENGVWGGAHPMVYVPFAQATWYRSPFVVIRTAGDPLLLAPSVRDAVRRIDPRLPLRDLKTLSEELDQSTAVPRFRTALFTALGALALMLAVTGIYGVMAYHVSRRRRETAIRRALGASGGQVVGTTLGAGMRIALAGILVGVAGAVLTARSLSSLLYRVEPHDPAVMAGSAGLVALAALAACLVPAVRATRIDPATLLRDE